MKSEVSHHFILILVKHDYIFSKLRVIIKEDPNADCDKIAEQVEKLSTEKKLNYEICTFLFNNFVYFFNFHLSFLLEIKNLDYEKFRIKKRKKKSILIQENELHKTNLENSSSNLSSFISSFSSMNNEENKLLNANAKMQENNFKDYILLEGRDNLKYYSNINISENISESLKLLPADANSKDIKKFDKNDSIETLDSPKLIEIDKHQNIINHDLDKQNNFIKEELNKFQVGINKYQNKNVSLNKLLNRNLQSCSDLRLFNRNKTLYLSSIFNKSSQCNIINKPEKSKQLSNLNMNMTLMKLKSKFSLMSFDNMNDKKPLIGNSENMADVVKILDNFYNGPNINKDLIRFVFLNYKSIKGRLKKAFKSQDFKFNDMHLPHRPNKHILLSNLGIFFKSAYFENRVFLDEIKNKFDYEIFPLNNCINNSNSIIDNKNEKNKDVNNSITINTNYDNIKEKKEKNPTLINEAFRRTLSSEFKFKFPIKIKNFVNENYSRIFIKHDLKFITPINKYFKISNNYIDDKIFESKNNIIRIKENYTHFMDLVTLKSFNKKIQTEYITLKGVLKGFLFYSEKKKFIFFVDEKTINTLTSNEIIPINYSFENLINKLKKEDNMPIRNEFLFASLKTDFIDKFKIIVINICDIMEVLKRRFLFNYQATEIILKNGKSYYFNFYRDFYVNEFHKFLKVIKIFRYLLS